MAGFAEGAAMMGFDQGSPVVSRRHCEAEHDGTALAYTVTLHANGTIITYCSAKKDRVTVDWRYRLLPGGATYAERRCEFQSAAFWLFTTKQDGTASAVSNEAEVDLACMDASLD